MCWLDQSYRSMEVLEISSVFWKRKYCFVGIVRGEWDRSLSSIYCFSSSNDHNNQGWFRPKGAIRNFSGAYCKGGLVPSTWAMFWKSNEKLSKYLKSHTDLLFETQSCRKSGRNRHTERFFQSQVRISKTATAMPVGPKPKATNSIWVSICVARAQGTSPSFQGNWQEAGSKGSSTQTGSLTWGADIPLTPQWCNTTLRRSQK